MNATDTVFVCHEHRGLTSICFKTSYFFFFHPFPPLPLAGSHISVRETIVVNDSTPFLVLCLQDTLRKITGRSCCEQDKKFRQRRRRNTPPACKALAETSQLPALPSPSAFLQRRVSSRSPSSASLTLCLLSSLPSFSLSAILLPAFLHL